MPIEKATGFTPSEKLLAEICDNTFLKLWSFSNPFNYQNKEFCDLVAIFENHMFIFFDRTKKLDFESEEDFQIKWNRWYKDVIEAQINTCDGAERYIKNNGELFLDNKSTKKLPVKFDIKKINIHKIIVAHGAKNACLKFSKENVNGSLGIIYNDFNEKINMPFFVHLNKNNPIHVFDSHNLEIILKELDTFCDFKNYIVEKERAIKTNYFLTYCGEEDLLAYYFLNFDRTNHKHVISEENHVGITLDQGGWNKFIRTPAYNAKKEADKISYFWDAIIQETSDNALNGRLTGNGNVFEGNSAIYEMAKEPRFIRRMLSEKMLEAIDKFPNNNLPMGRFIRVLSSYLRTVKYVFLQYKIDFGDKINKIETNKMRQYFLEIACGATKIKYPELEKIIGIGMEPIKYYKKTTKDFLLMDCTYWDDDKQKYYTEENQFELNRFFLTGNGEYQEFHTKEFPDSRLH
jgi:hypothetical protein